MDGCTWHRSHDRVRVTNYQQGVFRNSQHFIQLMNVGGLPRSMEFNNPQVQAPIIVMEVASKFSLYELISRINTARKWNRANPTAYTQQKLEFIPSRILWRMFLCCKPEPTETRRTNMNGY